MYFYGMNRSLKDLLASLPVSAISRERKNDLAPLIGFIQSKIDTKNPVLLHFICTHNSRRSQFAQLWAKVAAFYYNISCETFSGGVEVTACNKRVINTLKKQGFIVNKSKKGDNPTYTLAIEGEDTLELFSKLVDHPSNPTKGFAAVMTCNHADENCPFIFGAEQRIPLRYSDPKIFDNTPKEVSGYQDKSVEIAAEMVYVFASIKQQNHG